MISSTVGLTVIRATILVMVIIWSACSHRFMLPSVIQRVHLVTSCLENSLWIVGRKGYQDGFYHMYPTNTQKKLNETGTLPIQIGSMEKMWGVITDSFVLKMSLPTNMVHGLISRRICLINVFASKTSWNQSPFSMNLCTKQQQGDYNSFSSPNARTHLIKQWRKMWLTLTKMTSHAPQVGYTC